MDNSPSKGDKRNNLSPVAMSIGVLAIALPMAYTLSMGPMLWLATHGYLPDAARQFLSNFYAPLWIAARYLPFLEGFLHWYISLWD